MTVADQPAEGRHAVHVTHERPGRLGHIPAPRARGCVPGRPHVDHSDRQRQRAHAESVGRMGGKGRLTLDRRRAAAAKAWKRCVLAPSDFKYWTSNPSAGPRASSTRPTRSPFASAWPTATPGRSAAHTNTGSARSAPAPPDGDLDQLVGETAIPALDTLFPGYKMFECHDGVHDAAMPRSRAFRMTEHPGARHHPLAAATRRAVDSTKGVPGDGYR